MGFAQRPTVPILYGVNILLVVLAGILLMTRNSLAAYILVLLGAALVMGSRFLGYFRFLDSSVDWFTAGRTCSSQNT